jgi:hypothetical protein
MAPNEAPLKSGPGDGKKLKSKNFNTTPNCHAISGVAGIQNPCPGQQ